MSRITESAQPTDYYKTPVLPIIDWSSIKASAPKVIPFDYKSPTDPLPKADIVVITWTSAEWSALDHVMVNSNTTRDPYDDSWRSAWKLYSRGSENYSGDDLWGYFLLVEIDDVDGKKQTVLLFKSSSHLAHKPYAAGLTAMVENIVTDTETKTLYSIGTAGASTLEENLGDVVVTNTGHLTMKAPENVNLDYNHKTFTSDWFPSASKMKDVRDHLFMPLDKVLDKDEIYYLIDELHKENEASKPFGYEDLVNSAIDPSNTGHPQPLPCKGIPLWTTDYYFIAKGDDAKKYCTLEMDDSVVGRAAQLKDANFIFVRNISDTVVPTTAKNGTTIPKEVRQDWSGQIYKKCGFYTSFNGALTTWAAIAGSNR